MLFYISSEILTKNCPSTLGVIIPNPVQPDHSSDINYIAPFRKMWQKFVQNIYPISPGQNWPKLDKILTILRELNKFCQKFLPILAISPYFVQFWTILSWQNWRNFCYIFFTWGWARFSARKCLIIKYLTIFVNFSENGVVFRTKLWNSRD